MRIRRDHLGTGFEVWDGHRTWFWSVISPHRNGGAIGAAATEDEAVREARQSIEEIDARLLRLSTVPDVRQTGEVENRIRYGGQRTSL